jgi:hypothetical protein
MVPAIVWYHIKHKKGFVIGLISSAFFVVPAVVSYIVSVSIYINRYLPVKYNIQGQVNKNLEDLSPFFNRFSEINSQLIFSERGVGYYGYFIYFFILLLVLEIALKRKLNTTTRNWLYAVLIIYLGFPLLGYLLPLLDLNNSTKRGLFKIFPLMLLYLGNNTLLVSLSQRITKWEMK